MATRVDRALGSVVDHPWMASLLIVGLTAFSICGYVNPSWLLRYLESREIVETDNDNSVQNAERKAVPDVESFRLNDADTILVLDSGQFFTTEGVRALREVLQRLDSLDFVAGVMWMDRVPILNVFGLPEPILPRGEGSDALLQAARRKALEHPLVVGQYPGRLHRKSCCKHDFG